MQEAAPRQVWTIGHSTRAWSAFLALLRAHRIEAVADVRRFPASRMHPHFNGPAMQEALGAEGLAYEHFAELGGRRSARKDSHNTGWRNASFRGYADYMETAPFKAAMARLVALAVDKRTAIMCAESVWWRCHRGLIADLLKSGGVEVLHITDAREAQEHPYTGAASIVDGALSYAGQQPRLI